MQHKRRHPGFKLLFLLLVIVIGGGVLMTANVPSPMQPIEKQLDAKAFLGAKE